MSKIILKELFKGLQTQMVSQLIANRKFITHSGSKGDALENVWIEWLRNYLPNRYCVDKAIVIDSNGDTSHQIDVVIYDQHFTPFVFNQNGFKYIPAEGVYAVFEVKPVLKGTVDISGESYNFIEYAGQKIESVRKLKRTSVGIINAGQPTKPRALTKIIGGILASTNGITQNTIEKHLKSLKGLQTLEMGCAADFGSFYVDYNGFNQDVKSEDFQKNIIEYYEKRNFNKIVFSDKDSSMITFFLQLTHYLQQVIGTVASIDLNEYSKSVGFTIDENI
jgi:hypothetical protein